MCASSRTDGVDISGLSKTVKQLQAAEKKRKIGPTLEKMGVRLQKEHKGFIDSLDDMVGTLNPIDGVIAVAGFWAGWNGLTPMSMMFGDTFFGGMIGLKGGSDPFASIGDLPSIGGFMGFVGGIYGAIFKAAGVASKKKAGMTTEQIKAEIEMEELKTHIALGCVGLIEAIMITRPGALSGILSGIGSIVQGVGEIVPF